jgi:hypothetical protein
MLWRAIGTSVLLSLVCASTTSLAASRFAQTHSRSNYTHWIDLYDAQGRRIDPADPNAKPYSPLKTCGRCHDYEAIARGHHFNAMTNQVDAGRPGEPWIWTDDRTGTQIPLSYRDWPGVYNPRQLGISPWDFVLKFGHHLPGGGPGEPAPEPSAEAAAETPADASPADTETADGDGSRWELSGPLNVDCMFCHSNDAAYSPEVWWDQIQDENFAWAPTAALAIGSVEGKVSSLPDDFDPSAAEPDSRHELPKTTYAALRVNGDDKVFFDVRRRPRDTVCYYCHSTRLVGDRAGPEWTYDEDVHVKAGISCADCHRNGIEHHTVRGFEGEEHPTGEPVATLSCHGCHMDQAEGGGRLGAPKPLHKGLPPLHFDKLSCTACHSGPPVTQRAYPVQTALAHQLGLPAHYTPEDPPGLAAPVMLQDDGTLYAHRVMWPAFWGTIKDQKITPLNPDDVYDALRRTLRVRRGETLTETVSEVRLSSEDKAEALGEDRAKVSEDELTEQEKAKLAELERTKALAAWQEKLAAALEALKDIITQDGAAPVYVSGGKAYRLTEDGSAKPFQHDAAGPYAWKLAHDVRPARYSIGVKGCNECHSAGAPIFESKVTAIGPAPDEDPVTYSMYELAGYDKAKLDAWNLSFQGRTAFKWFGFVAMGAVGLIVLSYLFVGVAGLFGRVRV